MTVLNVLKQADIFYELTDTQLELIAAICQERVCGKDELIFAENTPGNEMYVIMDGEVAIELDPTLIGRTDVTEPQVLTVLGRWQVFGEVALVDEGVRSASARSLRHGTRVLVIPREKLMQLCETYPQLGFRLMRNLAADLAMKIRHTDLQIRAQLTWAPPEDQA